MWPSRAARGEARVRRKCSRREEFSVEKERACGWRSGPGKRVEGRMTSAEDGPHEKKWIPFTRLAASARNITFLYQIYHHPSPLFFLFFFYYFPFYFFKVKIVPFLTFKNFHFTSKLSNRNLNFQIYFYLVTQLLGLFYLDILIFKMFILITELLKICVLVFVFVRLLTNE